MSFESLTVKLKDGATYYFPAGAVSKDPSSRVDNLRSVSYTHLTLPTKA